MIRSISLVLIACAAASPPAIAQMKPPTPLTAQQFAEAVAGQLVVLAVRVTSRTRDTVHANLLERIDDAHYLATGTNVDLFFPSDTPVVMGSDTDVKAGAVLYVHAVATTRNQADVKQATVVTQYVTVR